MITFWSIVAIAYLAWWRGLQRTVQRKAALERLGSRPYGIDGPHRKDTRERTLASSAVGVGDLPPS